MPDRDNDRHLSVRDLAELFGGAEAEVAEAGTEILRHTRFSYRLPQGRERDGILLDILKRLDAGAMPVAGEARQGDWEKGWTENLDDLVASQFDIASLAPKYLRPGEPVRLRRELAVPTEPHFVRDYTLLFRNWIFRKYLAEAPNVYEFGCGPGAHVAYLASLYPQKRIMGLDWAESSVKILKALAEHYRWNIDGRRFDFFKPDESLRIERDAAVVTFGALEQTGARHVQFMDWLIENPPALCLHVEPIAELYDEGNLIDYLSLRYHRQRGYLDGLLTYLQRRQDEGRITIEKVHRHELGTKFAETYSYIVWRPR